MGLHAHRRHSGCSSSGSSQYGKRIRLTEIEETWLESLQMAQLRINRRFAAKPEIPLDKSSNASINVDYA